MTDQTQLAERLSALLTKLTEQSAQLQEAARGITDLISMKRFLANWIAPMIASAVEALNTSMPLLSLAYMTAEESRRIAEEARVYADLAEMRDVITFLVPAITLLSNLELPAEAGNVVQRMSDLVAYLRDAYPLSDEMMSYLLSPPEEVVEQASPAEPTEPTEPTQP